MKRILGWIRIGLIDLRGDLRRFGVLIACLALGTSTIAAVSSVGVALQDAIVRDATKLLGGDLETSRADRDANAEELAYLQSLGEVTHIVTTNARAVAGENSGFLDLVAVDDSYPLLGSVVSPELPPGERPAEMLAERDGAYGAILDAVLLDRLGIGVGGRFRIGETEYQARGTLGSLPDGAVRGFHLGLTALISTAALAATPDARPPLPGLLTFHRYKIVLREGLSYAEASDGIAARFKDEQWKTRSPYEAAGNLARYYDLFTRFLLIVGLSSLLVGGVGVSNGVSAYISERQRSIATMRSLGATGARLMVHFLAQVGVLALIGVGLGVIVGAVSTAIALPALGGMLGVDLPPSIDLRALLTAAAFGVLAAFAFAYLPLIRAQRVKPAILFRSLGTAVPPTKWRERMNLLALGPLVAAAVGIFLLAALATGDVTLVAYYTIGVVIAFLLLRGAGALLQVVLRLVPPLPDPRLRNALRNIDRPGSPAPVVIMSIGLGLAVLLVIALLDDNLYSQLLGDVTRDAPTFVATDLFDDEVDRLRTIEASDPRFERVLTSPMLRGAVMTIRGQPAAGFAEVNEEVAYLVGGEIPLTWLPDMPADTTLVEGRWWPADYAGPPLVSLRTSMRDLLGLKVGDTLTFDLYGDTIEAKIANFRDYQWQNGINFMVTFSPGALEGYPATTLATIKVTDGNEKAVERMLAREFPDVTFIPIGDALNQAATILSQVATAVNIVGGLAVINGLLVLAGTMAAGRKQREADAVIFKVLGATRRSVVGTLILEYGLLGAFASLIAAIVGIVGAWWITRLALEVGFGVDPVLVGSVIVGAITLTIGTGAAMTWSALSTRPAGYLRAAG